MLPLASLIKFGTIYNLHPQLSVKKPAVEKATGDLRNLCEEASIPVVQMDYNVLYTGEIASHEQKIPCDEKCNPFDLITLSKQIIGFLLDECNGVWLELNESGIDLEVNTNTSSLSWRHRLN